MRRNLVVGCLLIALLSTGCGEQVTPVGSVEVHPSEIGLLYPGFSPYRLTWTAERPLEGRVGDLRAAVHLREIGGDVLRTFDHALTLDWQPGQSETVERILYQSALAPPLEPGSYALEIGLYDSVGNEWQLTTSGATVRVEESTVGLPAFYFSPEWQPIEDGTDQQVLGRRWLRADGVIRLGELTRPGTLWLQLGVPAPSAGEQELELAEGATGPEVVVGNSCGGGAELLSGSGSHELMLSIVPPADPSVPPECEISIESNYALIAVEDRARRTVALESLSWLTE